MALWQVPILYIEMVLMGGVEAGSRGLAPVPNLKISKVSSSMPKEPASLTQLRVAQRPRQAPG